MDEALMWFLLFVVAFFAVWIGLPLYMLSRPSAPDECGNCKSTDLYHRQDGGHDYVLGCNSCKAEWGIQGEPFNLIERLR